MPILFRFSLGSMAPATADLPTVKIRSLQTWWVIICGYEIFSICREPIMARSVIIFVPVLVLVSFFAMVFSIYLGYRASVCSNEGNLLKTVKIGMIVGTLWSFGRCFVLTLGVRILSPIMGLALGSGGVSLGPFDFRGWFYNSIHSWSTLVALAVIAAALARLRSYEVQS